MAIIQALQAKADKAMGKDLSQREENEHKNESDSEDEYNNEYSDVDDKCTDNVDENDIPTSECNSTKQVFSNNQGCPSWGARDPPPPLVGPLLSKQPTIFRWRKRHDNILAVKAIVEKPTFLKKYFRQRLLSLVNMGLHGAIIRLSQLIDEGEQQRTAWRST